MTARPRAVAPRPEAATRSGSRTFAKTTEVDARTRTGDPSSRGGPAGGPGRASRRRRLGGISVVGGVPADPGQGRQRHPRFHGGVRLAITGLAPSAQDHRPSSDQGRRGAVPCPDDDLTDRAVVDGARPVSETRTLTPGRRVLRVRTGHGAPRFRGSRGGLELEDLVLGRARGVEWILADHLPHRLDAYALGRMRPPVSGTWRAVIRMRPGLLMPRDPGLVVLERRSTSSAGFG